MSSPYFLALTSAGFGYERTMHRHISHFYFIRYSFTNITVA
jgi:hypothetical protein